MHNHPFWQLDWYGDLKKNAKIFYEGNVYEMDSSQAILIPPYHEHKMEFKSSFRCCSIKFETNEAEFVNLGFAFIKLKDHRYLFDALFEDNDIDLKITGHALSILLLKLKKEHKELAYENNMRDNRIKKALEFIKRNLLEKLNASSLADYAGMSVNHFMRLFKDETGMSPMRYVREARVKKAFELLQYSDLTISQIADALDFSDLYSFSRSFKNISGMSPRAFRQKKRN